MSIAFEAVHRQSEPLFLSLFAERVAQSIEHGVYIHDFTFDFDLTGVETRDVEQIVEQLFERFGALQDLIDELAARASV